MLDPPVAGGFIFLIAGNAPDGGSRKWPSTRCFLKNTGKNKGCAQFQARCGRN
ncbi:hypothetical protein CLOSTASPAR_01416 [[Clostridium] asparagiforme DSM 15981]|uniref:Uncharacterized protein n=1 Tax=[Clostridium] asparagiforme DSM 15981 TaxID=518636 RepID=C0CWP5_9FIRM|nr:hypothetical protein CLOSTASPAR_01416 [[Clostridium] asparagiforme DSM 15981]